MKRKNKKAFTIVELVIVIAVIGVLAAILIPTFTSMTGKANEAADKSLVANLNIALRMAEADTAPNHTMHDAVLDVDEYGFSIDKLTSKSQYDLLWDSKENQFLLNNESLSGPRYWHIERSMPTTQKYSIYAGSKWTAKEITGLKVGFDCGYHDDLRTIEYVGIGSKQTVDIRTYGGDLSVNAPYDTVNHYAVAKRLNVVSVAPTDCYHEYGTVGLANIVEGKLVVEDAGFIAELTGESTATVEVEGTVMSASGDVADNITGDGNHPQHMSNILEVESFDDLQGMAYACNLGVTFEGKTIKLLNDIDMTNKIWVPFGIRFEKIINGGDSPSMFLEKTSYFFMGNIDGNGHAIKNLSNKGYRTEARHNSVSGSTGATYGLIGNATGDIKISNLDISFDIVSEGEQSLNCVGVIGFYYNQEINPILKHVKGENGWLEEYDEYDQERFDPVNRTYKVRHCVVEFDNVDVTGDVIGEDGISGYIGTCFASNDAYMFDDNATYYYSNSGNKYSGNGLSKVDGNATIWQAIAEGENGSGWYAQHFYAGNNQSGESNSITFYDGESYSVETAKGCTSSSKCVTHAPLFVNFKFTDCDSEINVTAEKRAGCFFGKISSGIDIYDQFTINFQDCTNSGNQYSKNSTKDQAGCITGFFGGDSVVENHETFTTGVTNTGTAYRRYGSEGENTRTGAEALLP